MYYTTPTGRLVWTGKKRFKPLPKMLKADKARLLSGASELAIVAHGRHAL